jgi:hypothetical protein
MRTLAGMWVSSSVLLHLSFLFETTPSLLMHHLVHIFSISLPHTCMIENFLGPWFSYLGERLCFLWLVYVKYEWIKDNAFLALNWIFLIVFCTIHPLEGRV